MKNDGPRFRRGQRPPSSPGAVLFAASLARRRCALRNVGIGEIEQASLEGNKRPVKYPFVPSRVIVPESGSDRDERSIMVDIAQPTGRIARRFNQRVLGAPDEARSLARSLARSFNPFISGHQRDTRVDLISRSSASIGGLAVPRDTVFLVRGDAEGEESWQIAER